MTQGYYEAAPDSTASDPWRPLVQVHLAHILGDGSSLLRSVLYIDEAGGEHLAPVGLLTDGGSKPRWSWAVFGHPYDPHYLPAYVVHDAECEAAHRVAACDPARAAVLRLHADRTFREGVLHLGASRWRAASYYRAVRFGAWFAARGWG